MTCCTPAFAVAADAEAVAVDVEAIVEPSVADAAFRLDCNSPSSWSRVFATSAMFVNVTAVHAASAPQPKPARTISDPVGRVSFRGSSEKAHPLRSCFSTFST